MYAPTPPTSSSPRANLDALLALLNSAAHEAIAVYEKSGYAPSLDTEHPLDSGPASLHLKRAIRTLEGACEQLCTTLAPPKHTLLNRSFGSIEPACFRVAIRGRVANALAEHPEGMSVSALAQKTGLERGKLGRILRFLATRNVFREGVFANNRLSTTLKSSTAPADYLLINSWARSEGSNSLDRCLIDPTFGPSYEPAKAPFLYHMKDSRYGGFFDYLRANPEQEKRFATGMVGLAQMVDSGSIIRDSIWSSLIPGTTVCDVGGGVGSVSIGLAKAYPHLLLTLQDQPLVLEQARTIWRKECREAMDKKRIHFTPFDFFKEGPVKAQDIYYVKQIIHDWPDSDALIILNNIRHSMTHRSRLFIHEHVLRSSDRCNVDQGPSAPEPLLANYGAGNIRPYLQDMNMMLLFNAKERTLDEFKLLGAQAGLEFVKLWDFIDNGILEFRAGCISV